jgi:hypothetical protein
MKKTLSLFFVLMIFSSVVFAGVIDDPSAPATGLGVIRHGKMVKVFYRSLSPGKVKVTILDADGREVFSENFRKTDGFMRPYNFSDLQEGDYTIELEDGNGKETQKVSYREGKILKHVNVVKISNEDSKYLLTVANKSDETLQIRIYNGANDLVYSGTEELTGNFAKLYNVKNIFGQPTFEVVDRKGDVTTFRY